MTRLGFLTGAFALFVTAGWLVERAASVPPRWRVRLGFLTIIGMMITAVSLVAAILLPEVLFVSSIHEIWGICKAAFRAIGMHPLGRWTSIVAGVVLAAMFGRFAWAFIASLRATRRARVTRSEPRWTLAGGARVYVLPLDFPEAYSVPGVRGQVIVTRGLLKALEKDEQRAVLLHEEGHIRARHHLLLSVARAAEAALAPLAPARWALAALEQALEEAADEYAAARLGSMPVATGLSKAALAGLSSPVGALSLGSGHDVPARVRRLLDMPKVPRWVPVACLLALAALLGVVVATQVIAGFAVVAATHHLLGVGAAATCPLIR
ncbi:MAG: M56 family metallopeptidase [Actinomycetota bacterium]